MTFGTLKFVLSLDFVVPIWKTSGHLLTEVRHEGLNTGNSLPKTHCWRKVLLCTKPDHSVFERIQHPLSVIYFFLIYATREHRAFFD